MIRKGIGLALGLVLATAMAATAAVPAPPVNQYLGIPDTVFNEMTEATCRSCHNQTPPAGIPVDPTYLPDRHHLLKGTPIPAVSAVITRDGNKDGINDTVYDCYNCHTATWNGKAWVLATFRDCTQCHQQTGGGLTVHHATTFAQAGDCAKCHGDFVDNGLLDPNGNGIKAANDATDVLTKADGSTVNGGWVPTYQPSLVTPWPSKKPNGGLPVNSINEKSGSCKYCHSNATGSQGPPVEETTGPFTPVQVYTNAETHHSTGFWSNTDTTKCTWCHNLPNGGLNNLSIRTCESCHGIPSLHNIQYGGQAVGAPSVGTIVPGAEGAGKGHIGDNADCNGCHGFTSTASAAPSGPVVPSLQTLSASSVTAGATVTLKGIGFVNLVQNPFTGAYDITMNSDVALIDANGISTILVPFSVTGDTLQVQIPANIAPGNYRIAASKAGTLSNPLNISVTPKVAISSKAGTTTVTIYGQGFGSYLNAVGSDIGVTGVDRRGKALMGTVRSWTDTKIVARFSSAPAKVTVNALFGSATK